MHDAHMDARVIHVFHRFNSSRRSSSGVVQCCTSGWRWLNSCGAGQASMLARVARTVRCTLTARRSHPPLPRTVGRRRSCRRKESLHRSGSLSPGLDTARISTKGHQAWRAHGCRGVGDDGHARELCFRQGAQDWLTHSCTSLNRSALGNSLRLSAARFQRSV